METALIVHKGIKELLAILRSGIAEVRPDFRYMESAEDLKEFLTSSDDKADLLLLGPHLDDPIPYLQVAFENDKELSVLLVVSPDKMDAAREKLRFTPFISNSFHMVESTGAHKVVAEVNEGIERTRQRRGYSGLNESLKNAG